MWKFKEGLRYKIQWMLQVNETEACVFKGTCVMSGVQYISGKLYMHITNLVITAYQVHGHKIDKTGSPPIHMKGEYIRWDINNEKFVFQPLSSISGAYSCITCFEPISYLCPKMGDKVMIKYKVTGSDYYTFKVIGKETCSYDYGYGIKGLMSEILIKFDKIIQCKVI